MATLNISVEHSSPSSETPKSTKKPSARGASFTPIENKAIPQAWIAASEDPIVGTEQKGNDFFSKIREIYNDKFKPAIRESPSLESVKARCKAIDKECILFSGCHARISRSQPTSVSRSDMIDMARALYNSMEIKTLDEDFGKPFKFIRAWGVLRSHQKFLVASKATKSTAVEDPCTVNSEGSGAKSLIDSKKQDPMFSSPREKRPIGRKRAKELKQKQDETTKKLRLAAESVPAQQERNKAFQRHYEIMLSPTRRAVLITTKLWSTVTSWAHVPFLNYDAKRMKTNRNHQELLQRLSCHWSKPGSA